MFGTAYFQHQRFATKNLDTKINIFIAVVNKGEYKRVKRNKMIDETTRLLYGQPSANSATYTNMHQQSRSSGISARQTLKTTSHFLFWIQAALIVLIATFAREQFIEGDKFLDVFQLFTGVEIMVLIGFGYLHTFWKRYSTSALGFTLFIAAIGLQWGILTEVSLYL